MTPKDANSKGALSHEEIDRLATYNAEVYRGLVHTEEYAERMRVLQERFSCSWRERAEREGWVIVE